MFENSLPSQPLQAAARINPIGTKLNFHKESGAARAEFTLNDCHRGISGDVHEGVLAFLIDEGMGWTARHLAGVSSVTAKLEVTYQSTARIGEPLVMLVTITRNTRRLVEETVRIQRPDGTLICEGTCLQYVLDSCHDGN